MLPLHLADYIFSAQKFIVSLIDNSRVYFLCYFPENPCLCPYLKVLYQWFTLPGSKFLILLVGLLFILNWLLCRMRDGGLG